MTHTHTDLTGGKKTTYTQLQENWVQGDTIRAVQRVYLPFFCIYLTFHFELNRYNKFSDVPLQSKVYTRLIKSLRWKAANKCSAYVETPSERLEKPPRWLADQATSENTKHLQNCYQGKAWLVLNKYKMGLICSTLLLLKTTFLFVAKS